MKRQIGLFIICMGVLLAQAQTTSTIRRLEKQRSELHKQISESESLLLSTKKDVKSQLDNLALLTGQISERQKYIWQIENDVRTIQLEINRLTIELKQLEKDLADKKEKYARSLRYMYRNKSVQEKLRTKCTAVCGTCASMRNISTCKESSCNISKSRLDYRKKLFWQVKKPKKTC